MGPVAPFSSVRRVQYVSFQDRRKWLTFLKNSAVVPFSNWQTIFTVFTHKLGSPELTERTLQFGGSSNAANNELVKHFHRDLLFGWTHWQGQLHLVREHRGTQPLLPFLRLVTCKR